MCMHIWALGLSCETPAASGPPGFHTTAQETQKRAKLWRERGKKREIWGPHHPRVFVLLGFFSSCCSVFFFFEKEGHEIETRILAKVGQLRLAKVGLAKVGLAKVGLSQKPISRQANQRKFHA